MRINLSKKNKIIAIVILVVVLGGSGGYLLWRVNQENTVSPTDSDASSCVAVCKKPLTSCTVLPGDNCSESCKGYIDENNQFACCEYEMKCTAVCGDGTCDSSESASSCPSDCAVCGDGVCSSTESLSTCAEDCSVCGDNKCTGSETASSCASDCSCKDFTWSNKPESNYKTTDTIATATITNPNSTSTSASDVVIKLNNSALSVCTSNSTTSCYTVASSTSGNEQIGIKFFPESDSLEEGTYTLSVSLPGPVDACSTTTTFTVSNGDVVVPQTGLFDGTLGKIYLGGSFVFLGVITTQVPKFKYMFDTLNERNLVNVELKRKKKEEERRNRFERRFK